LRYLQGGAAVTITIDQPGGAGAGTPSISFGRIGVPVNVTGGTHAEEPYAIADVTSGLTAAITDGGVLTTSGTVAGAVRLAVSDAAGESTYVVIGFTKDAAGVDLAVAPPPCFGERPGERNGDRSYATHVEAREAALLARVAQLEADLAALTARVVDLEEA
jgi:hypothetical protein